MKNSILTKQDLATPLAIRAAVLITACALAAGCAGTKTVETSDIEIAQISTKLEGHEWYKEEMLKLSLSELEEQLDLPVIRRSQKAIAKSYFDICATSTVYYYCVNAVRKYTGLVEAKRLKGSEAASDGQQDWVSRAYLGSAYALKARDYPIQGLWQVFPGPGFIRLYYLNRATAHLNAAVRAEPLHPIVRLIRSSTFIALGGKSATGRKDMQLLLSWAKNPESNADYADLMRLPVFRNEIYLEYITHHGADGGMLNDKDALPYWKAIADSKDNGHPMTRLAGLYTKQTK